MSLIFSFIFLLIFILGVYVEIQLFIGSKKIFSGIEKSFRVMIVDSALGGLSLSLLLFSGVFFITSVTDQSYQWEIERLIESFAFFLIPGLVAFLGSLWQYFLVGKYRDLLLKALHKRK